MTEYPALVEWLLRTAARRAVVMVFAALLYAVLVVWWIVLLVGCAGDEAGVVASAPQDATCPTVDSTVAGVCCVHTTLYGPTNELLTTLNVTYAECEQYAAEYTGYVAAWAPIIRRE
jgi:hypothetical protein